MHEIFARNFFLEAEGNWKVEGYFTDDLSRDHAVAKETIAQQIFLICAE